MLTPEKIYLAILTITQFIILLTFHEWGHAKSAYMLGDSTARDQGRLSLNPAVHIDPIGTLFLPLIGALMGGGFFGWAKPVPVNPYNLKKPRRDLMLIAGAGPFINIILTIAIFGIVRLLQETIGFQPYNAPKWRIEIYYFLMRSAFISVFLAAFNMLPLFPLDGFSVVNGILPERASRQFSKLAPYGMPILMALIFIPIILRVNGPLQLLFNFCKILFDSLAKIVGIR